MNFNFNIIDLEHIISTLVEMKTGIFTLVSIAGIHTCTLLIWLGYKYFNELAVEKTTDNILDDDDIELPVVDIQLTDISEINIESNNTMFDKIDIETQLKESGIKISDNERELYNNMVIFSDKKSELEELIDKLSTIQSSLEVVREKLSDLNNSPEN